MRRFLALAALLLAMPAAASAQSALLSVQDQWRQAASIVVGPLVMQASGVQVLHVVHSWKGSARRVTLQGVTQDSWSQALRPGDAYVAYLRPGTGPASVTVTSL